MHRVAASRRCAQLSASAVLCQRRQLTNVFDKFSDAVSSAVSDRLSTSAVFAESRAVTERRRKVEKRRPIDQTLAQRLHTQRRVRQHLIPTSVTVDASKQYVTFTWPFEAQRRAEEDAATRDEPDSTREPHHDHQPHGVAAADATPSEETPTRSPHLSSAHAHRTRALAEYLRAYTPSTDGTFGSNMLVYGRRGIVITDIVPMGSYALRFCFSDGHTGGIYSYEYLYDLTRSGNKYHMMRAYLAELRAHRKSRDPPNRARSKRRHASSPAPSPAATAAAAPEKKPANDDNTYRAPSFPPAGDAPKRHS